MANENDLCRSCGVEPVDPNNGPYDLCTGCWEDFESDMDAWYDGFMDANPEFDDYPF
jgi:hypothetical protein